MSGEGGTVAASRLVRLELQGFKSFASRTVFAFEPGITAVVGPNGSGKSNIADAVRWVLGEQGYGALRAKRTDDVIFAGGHGRAPAGMAEASLTFDNNDRWLPIDFAEVTVTRRAFRGGETQYLINGRRVRLKDVALLTASLGQSHVVVGQGLVDAALSQRAEERRGLFEHAADLSGLRLKVAEAERHLAETEMNSTRLNDLLGELAPRLKTLERAAKQAREWQGLRDRLQEMQRAHFGRVLAHAQRELAAAEAAAEGEAARVATARAEAERLAAAAAAARQRLDAATDAIAAHDAGLQELTVEARRVAHERDLAAERRAALGKRGEDMADTQAALAAQAAAVADELARLGAELTELEAATSEARRSVAAGQAEAARVRAARAEGERRVAALAKAAAEAERRGNDLARRRMLLEQRRETDAAEWERIATAVGERSARLDRLGAELAAADEGAKAGQAGLADLDARLADLAAAADRAAATLAAARAATAEAERRLGEATTRRDVLRHLHESGAGLYAGVRETLVAGRGGTLAGVRGTVAELLEVPAEYETALEVALGGHLQDVVVERWVDAEAAIVHLKRTKGGRATFQPLDTVRGGSQSGRPGARGTGGGPRWLPREALALPGARGVAGDLVRAAPELGGVVEALLGRTLVVADLPTARTALPLLPSGWSAVTLAGEIARAGGSVTGGAAVRESGVLGRERELRELPAAIDRLEGARDEARAAQAAAAEEARRLAEERRAVDAARAGEVAAAGERRRQRDRLAAWLTELRAEQSAAERRLVAVDEGLATAQARVAELDEEARSLALEIEATGGQLAAARAEQERLASSTADGERVAAEHGRRLAALEERLRAERRREAGLRVREQAVAEETALRAERVAALDRERAALGVAHEALAREAATLDEARAAKAAERAPLAAAVREAAAEVERLDRALEAGRAAVWERERAHGAAALAAARACDELEGQRRRAREELGADEGDALAASCESMDAAEVGGEAETREREIARLKERLRRVGYVGEDAVAEFEREAERQAFLRGQLADVDGAAASLRMLLADLRGTMRARFDETFARVAEVFAETFAGLFGGGAARLILTTGEPGPDGDAGPPGIDIVAQPPGKRLQSLALLSGGERALTAAALLIAILRVNPAPFCLLDEVDAALDEANVVRFREKLRALAAETQVIVVTHNRGTIETADALYGVSMGTDGVSQVLSLRLSERAEGGGQRAERVG